ncbi:MAG: aspartate dehydrogenase [Candidatus Methanoperedens sp.]|nr:aspartate dehydrogenase [Candidatus Methanoperedens sp.]
MLKIGVIGCGTIGKEICKAIDSKRINAQLVGVHDKTAENCERLLEELDNKPEILPPSELISKADIIVESASQAAVREFGHMVLEAGKDLMVMSVGAFTEPGLLGRFKKIASDNHCKIYIPSGAIAGLDGLKSSSMAALDKVTLTTTKNPQGLKGALYIIRNKIQLDSFLEKTLLFEGSAEEAIRGFPENVNIAASLSLAGIGVKETRVRIFIDPAISRNIHEIAVEGAFGKFTCRIENVPSPGNPRTSFLASLSAIATLKNITEPLQIGT